MNREEFTRRSQALLHAIQSGVAHEMRFDAGATEGKHLRVGVNNALLENAAVAKILIDKGLITEEEYFNSVIARLEEEKARYEARISARHNGAKITLA